VFEVGEVVVVVVGFIDDVAFAGALQADDSVLFDDGEVMQAYDCALGREGG
jgi:hypothetical protein